MSASVQAVFEQADANHDGVITQAEFASAMAPAPVVYSSAAPVYYTGASTTAPVQYVTAAPPVYVTGEMAQLAEAPVIYTSGYSGSVPAAMPYSYPYTTTGPLTYSAAPMMTTLAPAVDTYKPEDRITYQSVTTGQTFPGKIVDMYTDGGCQVMLDVDGGVKDVFYEDMWRVKAEGAAAAPVTTEATTTTTTKKAKKSKKVSKKSKGCC